MRLDTLLTRLRFRETHSTLPALVSPWSRTAEPKAILRVYAANRGHWQASCLWRGSATRRIKRLVFGDLNSGIARPSLRLLGVIHHPADVDEDDRLVAYDPAVVAGGQQR